MTKNNEESLQISLTIQKYYDVLPAHIRKILDRMPYTQETLDIIESELARLIDQSEDESERDAWARLMYGVETIEIVNKYRNEVDED